MKNQFSLDKEKRVHMVDRAAIITVNDGRYHQEIFLNKNDLHARGKSKEEREAGKKLISFPVLLFSFSDPIFLRG